MFVWCFYVYHGWNKHHGWGFLISLCREMPVKELQSCDQNSCWEASKEDLWQRGLQEFQNKLDRLFLWFKLHSFVVWAGEPVKIILWDPFCILELIFSARQVTCQLDVLSQRWSGNILMTSVTEWRRFLHYCLCKSFLPLPVCADRQPLQTVTALRATFFVSERDTQIGTVRQQSPNKHWVTWSDRMFVQPSLSEDSDLLNCSLGGWKIWRKKAEVKQNEGETNVREMKDRGRHGETEEWRDGGQKSRGGRRGQQWPRPAQLLKCVCGCVLSTVYTVCGLFVCVLSRMYNKSGSPGQSLSLSKFPSCPSLWSSRFSYISC